MGYLAAVGLVVRAAASVEALGFCQLPVQVVFRVRIIWFTQFIVPTNLGACVFLRVCGC
jgi:hypothetical protein